MLVGLVAVGSLLAGCSSGGDGAVPEPETTTSEATTTTTTAPPEVLPVFPLTGLPADDADTAGAHPAIVVKIDDGIQSRPQTGLNQADIVIEEEVEGVTRLASVYHSTLPEVVGNVRSGRSSDIDIVSQFSQPLLAWSGGNAGVTGEILRAASAGLLTNASADLANSAYYRSDDRKQPYNLYVRPSQLLELRAPDGQGAPAPVFTFRGDGAALPATAIPSFGITVPFTRYTTVTYAWDAEKAGWLRFQVDSEHPLATSAFVDSDGVQVAPANVVVMLTPYGTSAADSRSPQALTVGEGDAFVFSDGSMIVGRWVRSSPTEPPVLTTPDGTPIELTPGRTWVELPRTGTNLTLLDQAGADPFLAVQAK